MRFIINPSFNTARLRGSLETMPCFKPLLAWRSNSRNVYGKIPMVFSLEKGIPGTEIELPCGQCAGCRLDYARQWAIRCCHEAHLHHDNCFLTLTYRDIPENGSLQPKHMQDFLKRLRKSIEPKKIRFFQCGEYGDSTSRPHHHMLLFNHRFDDMLIIRRGDYPLFNSATLDQLWGHGFCSIGELNFDTACYCARYILKKITGEPAADHYSGRKPEYTTMSRRPGIGRGFYDLYPGDIYNFDRVVVTDQFLCKPPKFYDKLFEVDQPEKFQQIKEERRRKAIENTENTPERRKIKKELTSIRQKQISRNYEDEKNNLHSF